MSNKEPKTSQISLIVFGMILIIFILSAALVLIKSNPSSNNPSIVGNLAIVVGLTIILGICVLIVLLFMLAVGFKVLGMNKPGQALGLPKGSIRALLALLLLLIWVILSVFIFEIALHPSISSSSSATPSANATTSSSAFFNVRAAPTATATLTATATPSTGATPSIDISQLAQQFFTTMATLVTAVIAFYFGSRTAAGATQPNQPGQQPQMTVSSNNLEFTTTRGNNPAAQTISIQNTGGGTLTWTAGNPSEAWLTVTPTSGSNTAGQSTLVTFNVDVTGMAVGTSNASVDFTSSAGNTVTVAVKLTIS